MLLGEDFSYEQYLAMRSAMRIRLVLKVMLLEDSITHDSPAFPPHIAVLKP